MGELQDGIGLDLQHSLPFRRTRSSGVVKILMRRCKPSVDRRGGNL